MAKVIKIKRGLQSNLPVSAPIGEPLFAQDTGNIYMGTESSIMQLAGRLGTLDGKSADYFQKNVYKIENGGNMPPNPINGDFLLNETTAELFVYKDGNWLAVSYSILDGGTIGEATYLFWNDNNWDDYNWG